MNTKTDESNVAAVKQSKENETGSDENVMKTANESGSIMDFSLNPSMSFDAIMSPRIKQLNLLLSNVTGLRSVSEKDDEKEEAEEADPPVEDIPPRIHSSGSDSDNKESKELLIKQNQELEKRIEEVGLEKKLEGQQYRKQISDLKTDTSNKQRALIHIQKKYDLLSVQTDRLQQELAATTAKFAEAKRDYGAILRSKDEEIAELKEQVLQDKKTSKEYTDMIKSLKSENANLTAMTLR